SDTPGTNNAQAANFAIGATNFYNFPNNLEFFKGLIDEVAIYNHALTADEIRALAAGVSPLSVVPEPASLGLAAVGLASLALLAYRRRTKAVGIKRVECGQFGRRSPPILSSRMHPAKKLPWGP
ncbi:MAG: PEP-CTERM sorting domain-containing protein, partial [Thermoguttaceae bacterium]|nr:PEP-CTERM sorting domain-containing protein [Thermoguttaceae bacterium]MDW8036408.1 LamG-like jellyroll fold domain-containing protein [Thermoguttaceae bacterium]